MLQPIRIEKSSVRNVIRVILIYDPSCCMLDLYWLFTLKKEICMMTPDISTFKQYDILLFFMVISACVKSLRFYTQGFDVEQRKILHATKN